MTNIEHDTDADLAGLSAGLAWMNEDGSPEERAAVTVAVIGLTNFGEHPVPSTRLAEILGRPVSEAEALARQWGWPGTRVEDGLITVNPERAKSATRRHVQIGDRRLGVTGCGCDIFLYASLVRPSLVLEETCTVTGTPIRIVFTPSGVESVEPSGAVLPMLPSQIEYVDPAGAVLPMRPSQGALAQVEGAGDVDDANICVQFPLFSSAEAAKELLAAHPGLRAIPIRQAWDLAVYRNWRDRMSALLDLGT